MDDNQKYLSMTQAKQNYPFTMGQLRTFLKNRHKNNLSKAVRKIGKRIYLKKDLWEAWIESHQEKGGAQ